MKKKNEVREALVKAGVEIEKKLPGNKFKIKVRLGNWSTTLILYANLKTASGSYEWIEIESYSPKGLKTFMRDITRLIKLVE